MWRLLQLLTALLLCRVLQVMDKLDSLVKVYQEKQAPKRDSSGSKWSFF